jgi:hypothetical protein
MAASLTAKHPAPGVVVTFTEIYNNVPKMLQEGSQLGDSLALAAHQLRSDMRLMERYTVVNTSELPGCFDETLGKLAKKVAESEDLSVRFREFLGRLSTTKHNLTGNICYFRGLKDEGATFDKSVLSETDYQNEIHESLLASTKEATIKTHVYVLRALTTLVGYRVELDNLEDRLNVAQGKTLHGFTTSLSEARSVAQPILDVLDKKAIEAKAREQALAGPDKSSGSSSWMPGSLARWAGYFTGSGGLSEKTAIDPNLSDVDLESLVLKDGPSEGYQLKDNLFVYIQRIATQQSIALPVLEKIEKNQPIEETEMLAAIEVLVNYLNSVLPKEPVTALDIKNKVGKTLEKTLKKHLKYIFGEASDELKVSNSLKNFLLTIKALTLMQVKILIK